MMKRKGINKRRELKVELVNSITGTLVQVRAEGTWVTQEVVNDPDPQNDIWGDDDDGSQEPEETKYPAADHKIGTETSSHEGGVV